MAPMCSETYCYPRCHQAYIQWCNNQPNSTCKILCPYYYVKMFSTWCWRLWNCYPASAVFELLTRTFAVGKSCSVYNNPIWSCFVNLAYLSEDYSSNNACHLTATCSGFTIPWELARAWALSTPIWRCHLHFVLQQVDLHPFNSTPLLQAPLHHHWIDSLVKTHP